MIEKFKEILYECTKDFALAEDAPSVEELAEELYKRGWNTQMVQELCRRLKIIWNVYNKYNIKRKGYEVPVLGAEEFNLTVASVGTGESLGDFVEDLAYGIKKELGIDVDVDAVLEVKKVKGNIEKYVKIGELVKEYPTLIKAESALRRKWNEWDMIREFVQNSLDASGRVDIVRIEDGVLISDRGGGFDATAFLIGESTKNPKCDRGQFGDGMKMACATALLLGYDVWIHTKGYVFKPVIKPYEFVTEEGVVTKDVLWFEQYKADKRINGTDVYILGYSGSLFRENFILYDGNDAFEILYKETVDLSEECGRKVIYHRCIMRPENKLFVKDIYVEDLEGALYSYNLVDVGLGVDRKIASSSDVQKEIINLWFRCKDVDLLTEFVKNLLKVPTSYEYKMGWDWYGSSWFLKDNWNTWLEAIKRAVPYAVKDGKPMFYYAKDNDEIELVKYYAPEYVYIPLPEGLLHLMAYWAKVIPKAQDIIADRRKAKATILKDKELDKNERRVLNFIRKIHEKLVLKYTKMDVLEDRFFKRTELSQEEFAEIVNRLSSVKIYAMEHEDPNVLGIHRMPENIIGIRKDRLWVKKARRSPAIEAIEIYSHELVHVILGGDKESNSVDFLQAQQEVLLDIMHIIANREVRVPKSEE